MQHAQMFVSVSINCVNEVAGISQPAHASSCGQQRSDSVDVQQHCKAPSAAAGYNNVARFIYPKSSEVKNRRGKNAESVTHLQTLFVWAEF
jgi:hypothetical protein